MSHFMYAAHRNTLSGEAPENPFAVGWFASWVLLLLLLTLTAPGFAQQRPNAGLTGNITDKSGSTVGNAQVVATNHETGVTYTATATAAGVYHDPLAATRRL